MSRQFLHCISVNTGNQQTKQVLSFIPRKLRYYLNAKCQKTTRKNYTSQIADLGCEDSVIQTLSTCIKFVGATTHNQIMLELHIYLTQRRESYEYIVFLVCAVS